MNQNRFLDRVLGVLLGVLLGVVALFFIGLCCCGAYCVYYTYKELNECIAKGHSRIYCDRTIHGNNFKLDEGDLDK